MTVGQESTGFAFDIQAETELSQVNMASMMNAFEHHDLMSALMWPGHEIPIANSNVSLIYNPQRSTAKVAKFTFTYGKGIFDYRLFDIFYQQKLFSFRQCRGNSS